MIVSVSKSRGFTLSELLIALAVISVIVALAMPGYQLGLRVADQTKCNSNLRQIGVAMAAYVVDHDGALPGPLYTKQGSYYGTRDANALPMRLAPYLGLPENVVFEKAKLFECPAWRRSVVNDQGKIYAIQTAAVYSDGTSGQPFGYPAAPPYAEKPVARIVRLASPQSTPALWDYDALNGGSTDSTAAKKPVHTTVRNNLFFDWHVEAVPVTP